MEKTNRDIKNFQNDLNWMKKVKRAFLRGMIIGLIATGIILISLIVLIPSHITRDYQNGFDVGYDKGYIYGWHESGFIDCSLPSINKTMQVVQQDTSIHLYFKWGELCERLNSQ